MKEMDKKFRCRDVLWGVRFKDNKDIIVVCEYRSEARELKRNSNDKVEIVRLCAAPERLSKRSDSYGRKNESNKSKQPSAKYFVAENQLTFVY